MNKAETKPIICNTCKWQGLCQEGMKWMRATECGTYEAWQPQKVKDGQIVHD